jgi:GT2 family glycosyltransferase
VTASIVIPCHNNLHLTRQCLVSIARHTPDAHEVVLVDNGSTDGTAEWFAGCGCDGALVKNPENLGFAAAANQGLAAAEGTHVVLLNNDTIVTPGWLTGLLAGFEREAGVGIVAPRANYVGGEQLLRGVSYDSAPSPKLDGFAAERHLRLAGRGFETRVLSGLCMAISAAVVDAIGGFDPAFGIGGWEDIDYSLRARLAGFRLWVAEDSYVHHFGGETFGLLDASYEALIRDNEALYAAKWGVPLQGAVYAHAPGRPFDPSLDRIPLPLLVA